MNIFRVFPRRTKATPDDNFAAVGYPDLIHYSKQIEKVLISVTFSWDIPNAEKIAESWRKIAEVEIGGPAFMQQSGEFEPGKFLKPGYVITSRGCDNRCWFCCVWRRENGIKELKIKEGNNILDDNLLACSEAHIRAVFDMLKDQNRATFSGGLEAKELRDWHIDLLSKIKIRQMFFSYDTEDDYEPLLIAGKKLMSAGFKIKQMRCYVLIGYPGDTIGLAEKRLRETLDAGFLPFAMTYRDDAGIIEKEWARFAKGWIRIPLILRK
jgi:hypothetical protein